MKSLLQASHLTLQIKNKILCEDLSIELKAGDIWGILGPNGSGKTTFLHSLAGLLSTSLKHIFLYEKPLLSYSRKNIARIIGILFQDTQFIFPQSVFEFCLSGRYPHSTSLKEDHLIVESSLASMHLDKLYFQNIQTLSGGEKRRLAIATLLAQTPQIYLLDEPTNHLDIKHQMLTLQYFSMLAKTQEKTIIMTMHDIQLTKQFCNKILMIFPNGKTLHGSSNEVLTTQLLSELYEFNFEEI